MLEKTKVVLKNIFPLLLIIAAVIYILKEINNQAKYFSFAYPKSVVEYAFVEAKTPDDMIELVKEWNSKKWGAQISAIRVLCKHDYPWLVEIASQEGATKICRVTR